MNGIEDATALVTGGASGIGNATARRFAAEGAQVVLADVDAEGGEQVAADIRDGGGDATFVPADVTDVADIEGAVRTAVETYGGLDVAHNNVGWAGIEPNPLGEISDQEWARELDLSLTATWRCMKRELPHLRDGGGAIVNTSSIAGIRGRTAIGPYAVAKHGLVGLTRSAALEYASDDIRVNAICPGPVDTPALRQLREDALERQRESVPLDLLADPDEIAAGVVWLSSADASFVTGHALVVDGGKSIGPTE
jgi:NAD(P)-dependent dehydrogenase (short-subunit alcohol dehydrogenase family)